MTKNIPDEVSNSDDILDSRNIQERFDYLQGQIQDAFSDAGREEFDFVAAWEKDHNKTESIIDRLVGRDLLDSDVFPEWEMIRKTFIDNVGDNSEWEYGMAFLRDSYMDEDWAEQEMQGLG